ncbi:MAG: sugar ABC transporter permease [Oscillospiraceae bacterium]|nr:sugar ABC transporter permease [Oscillospiraceae bacterium]
MKQLQKEEKKADRRRLWIRIKQNKEAYLMMLPFMLVFVIFTVVPVLMSLPIGLTDFDMVTYPPKWVGLDNFYHLFLNDSIFIKSIRVTLVFAIFTGPLSYLLSFLLAWLINEMNKTMRVIFTLIFYAPSMASGVYAVWQLIFSGDSYGIANSALLNLGITTSAIQWLTDSRYILTVVIIVQLWVSMGAGFLAMRAGFQNIDRSQYEAGAIEGIRNRWQELIYITIPGMGPSLMFAAVMQIVSAFTADIVARNLVGFPSTDYAAHTIMTHAFDYGWIRYEMGYASAICMILFIAMFAANKFISKLLGKYME